jgi:hypothetical protein
MKRTIHLNKTRYNTKTGKKESVPEIVGAGYSFSEIYAVPKVGKKRSKEVNELIKEIDDLLKSVIELLKQVEIPEKAPLWGELDKSLLGKADIEIEKTKHLLKKSNEYLQNTYIPFDEKSPNFSQVESMKDYFQKAAETFYQVLGNKEKTLDCCYHCPSFMSTVSDFLQYGGFEPFCFDDVIFDLAMHKIFFLCSLGVLAKFGLTDQQFQDVKTIIKCREDGKNKGGRPETPMEKKKEKSRRYLHLGWSVIDNHPSSASRKGMKYVLEEIGKKEDVHPDTVKRTLKKTGDYQKLKDHMPY